MLSVTALLAVPFVASMILPDHDAFPLIDVRDTSPRNIEALSDALSSTGYFFVANEQDIFPPRLKQAVFEQSKAFFALPSEEKMQYLRNVDEVGYDPYEYEHLDPDRQPERGDLKEGFTIGRIDEYYAENIWPSVERNPQLAQFKQVMSEYFEHAQSLGHAINSLIALALNQTSEYFVEKNLTNQPLSILRLLHYTNAENSDEEKGVFGCGAHSDFGGTTLLLTDTAGLQFMQRESNSDMNGEWQDIPTRHPAIAGDELSFIANIGDMFEFWTNDVFVSNVHRVMINKEINKKDRFSVAFFLDPNFDANVECIDVKFGCPDDVCECKYAPRLYSDHIRERYSSTSHKFDPEEIDDGHDGGVQSRRSQQYLQKSEL
mmetsp:Transcript_12286/g.18516  ORF Transcript_12286/g.18516 Transcript_12286/m.18516 type:complete len:375 (+) Transcript_12286:36-1160(+)